MPGRNFSLLALALAAVAAAGCGSSSSSSSSSSKSSSKAPAKTASSGAATSNLKTEADEEGGLYFSKKKLTAKAGTVTLTMENPKTSRKKHGIAIEGKGVDKDGKIVAAGGTSTVTVSLKPGTYTFYCPVPGHRAAGMKGTLTVQ